ncbi:hypothetical protein B0A55_04871 [Friedmanniomyces simplex]|uniref:Uncharacterized protein n=1 Tax=Friedmanniomyces simplex TaxID=329884 RepID=A0A4V5NGT1_9PEZI|nr:hypothetical protein B0A55_04871 [Friedmanniomyces simplex]
MRPPTSFLLLLFCLCSFLTAAAAASAKPIRHTHGQAVESPGRWKGQRQQPLTSDGARTPAAAAYHWEAPHLPSKPYQPSQPNQPSRHSSHLDAAPNSVGMLFTTANHNDDDARDVLHVWLPLGKRVFTRDEPYLPLHPVTARITTMIRSTPRIATPEHLEKILCRIYPRYNLTAEELEGDLGDEGPLALEVRRRDGLVHLAGLSKRVWREVEAYECS